MGLPKCGSSALQQFFLENLENLNASDIDYPILHDSNVNDYIVSGNGALLARSYLLSDDPSYIHDPEELNYNNIIEVLKKSPFNNIIISSEFFSICNFSVFTKLKNDLICDLKFIFYYRNQVEILISNYFQSVKRHGNVSSPKEYIDKIYASDLLLKYDIYFQQYLVEFGMKPLILINYEECLKREGGIFSSFISNILTEIPAWAYKFNKIVNKSLTPFELHFLLSSNLSKPSATFVNDFLNFTRIKSCDVIKPNKFNLLDDNYLTKLRIYFDDINHRFFLLFNAKVNHDQISNYDFIDYENYSFESKELLRVITYFLVTFHEKNKAIESDLFYLQNQINEIKNNSFLSWLKKKFSIFN
jgi:hypothetical protein